MGSGSPGEIFLATAGAINEVGVSLVLAGQTAPTKKFYKSLASARISTGDPVICTRISGTIIILGKLGLAQDGGQGYLFVPDGSTGLKTRDGRVFICQRV